MPSHANSLPAAWVDSIFSRLAVRYGTAFTDKWRDVDPALVKADWGRELGGFADKPECIAHALENLPPIKAPTVSEFRFIANGAPVVTKQLPPPKATPEVIKQAVQSVHLDHDKPGPKDWAKRILARHANGERVLPVSLRFAREALGVTE